MENDRLISMQIIKDRLWSFAIESSLKEQDVFGLYRELESYVHDISEQYTNFKVEGVQSSIVRASHTFQMKALFIAIEMVRQSRPQKKLIIGDIGDSSGTHMVYVKKHFSAEEIETLGVNMDPVAIEKIQKRGLAAVCCRAEDLDYIKYPVDIFCSFQMLEHLENPIGFLKKLSDSAKFDLLVISVPYVNVSRVGLEHIALGKEGRFPSEITHIYEFSPRDWSLLARHCGFEVVWEKVFHIFPDRVYLKWLKLLLHGKNEALGNYCMVLRVNRRWRDQYAD